MYQTETIARPYAKAAFEFALKQDKLDLWANLLQNAALIAANQQIKNALINPNITADDILEMFLVVLDNKIDKFGKNFLSLLAHYHRLGVLPEIAALFKQLCDSHNETIEVKIISAFELMPKQKSALIKILEKKLQCKVKVACEIDENILGGAIIKAKDLVIDGSGRKILSQLHTYLRGAN